jgi:hypothetical protein
MRICTRIGASVLWNVTIPHGLVRYIPGFSRAIVLPHIDAMPPPKQLAQLSGHCGTGAEREIDRRDDRRINKLSPHTRCAKYDSGHLASVRQQDLRLGRCGCDAQQHFAPIPRSSVRCNHSV